MDELTLIGAIDPDAAVRGCGRRGRRTRALFEPLLDHQKILRRIIDAGLGEWIGVRLLDLRNPDAVRQRALTRRAQLPAREALHRWDNDLCRVLDGKADEKMVSVLLAIMLDGFPRGMIPNVQTYADAALLALGETVLSPQVLAAAIVRIWRKDRFPPTIADLLDECERARQAALNARRVVAKMIELLDNAEEALASVSDLRDDRRRP
jgi:hypothetical protein